MTYPKFLYHRTEQPRIVQDADEQAALGPEWAETPAAFVESEVIEQPVKKGRKR